jgi:hypothetical protein
VYDVIGWDDLTDIGRAPSEGAGRRILVTRAIAAWNLVDEFPVDGEPKLLPVPITEATVRLLEPQTLEALAEHVNAAHTRATAPLPNAPGAPSRPSQRESAPSTPTTPTP